jgi:hypothetical protein
MLNSKNLHSSNLQSVEDQQVVFGDIGTAAHDSSDSLTKQSGRIKFCQHHDILPHGWDASGLHAQDPPALTSQACPKCHVLLACVDKPFDCFDFDPDTVTIMGS